MEGPDLNQYRYILSIDIGIHHCALILLETEKNFIIRDVVWFDLIDITQFQHLDNSNVCQLAHSRTIADWINHVLFLNQELFNLCEFVLLERQPPGGQIAVEQVFFFALRDKAKLIHPRSVHAFFGWSQESYEIRKQRSTDTLRFRLDRSTRPWLKVEFQKFCRGHDIGDAYCQAVYFLHYQYLQHRQTTIRAGLELSNLEKFRYDFTV